MLVYGWTHATADRVTSRVKITTKLVSWVYIEATSVFSMPQLPKVAPTWAPYQPGSARLEFLTRKFSSDMHPTVN